MDNQNTPPPAPATPTEPSRPHEFTPPNMRRYGTGLPRFYRPGFANTERFSTIRTHVMRRRVAAIAILLLLVLAAGFIGGWYGAGRRAGNTSLFGSNTSAVQRQVVLNEGQLISEIAKTVSPSVVSVDVTSQTQTQNFFGFSQPQEQQGAGTGIIITSDGLIVTNRHVVPAGTTQVSVTLADGTKLDNVDVVGRTADSDSLDIAFLKVKDAKGHKLQPALIGDSSKMQVGDRVIAIGNALGQFQNSVTSGIISGYGRDIQAGDESGSASTENLQDLFQTDAAINPGNSGGPLVNSSNEVIGINVAVADAQNIGFAIPINDVKGLIAGVEKTGKLERPYLGVRYVSLTDDAAYVYNLDVKRGAYIAPGQDGQPSIIDGSPADKAGLKEKDIIVAINDQKIDETHSLTSVLGTHSVGDEVTLTINRDGKNIKVKATLEAAPQK
jgi:S1-C subfamily serine protease